MLKRNRFYGSKKAVAAALTVAMGLTIIPAGTYAFAGEDITYETQQHADVDIQLSANSGEGPQEMQDLMAQIDIKNDSGGIACLVVTVEADGYSKDYRMVFEDSFMSDEQDTLFESSDWTILKNDADMTVGASGNINMDARDEVFITMDLYDTKGNCYSFHKDVDLREMPEEEPSGETEEETDGEIEGEIETEEKPKGKTEEESEG